MALREIDTICRSEELNPTQRNLVESLTFRDLEPSDEFESLEDFLRADGLTTRLADDKVRIHWLGGNTTVHPTVLQESFADPNKHRVTYCKFFLAFKTTALDGMSRLNLVNEQEYGDLQSPPANTLARLFHNDQERAELRQIVFDALSAYLVLDPTKGGRLRVRLSKKAPDSTEQEKGLHREAIDFHSQAIMINQASDGVRAFCGIMVQVISGAPKVIIIDEPEAFLHPALSFKLGKQISIAAYKKKKTVFAATHSADFLMGCIHAGCPINIFRLNFDGRRGSVRVLESEQLAAMMRSPLLRSSAVLNALFHEYVIVTEADTDRAFYQEINERLVEEARGRGIANCLFINAHNKQTIKDIVWPLREMGIPTAAIVDIDIVKMKGAEWDNFLHAGLIPEPQRKSLTVLRHEIVTALASTGKEMKRHGGVGLLPRETREAAENMLRSLAEYGLFVVPGGELEVWLQEMGAKGHGPSWLKGIFAAMGDDPSKETYVHPSEHDVWKFIDDISAWFNNPNRRGLRE